MVYGRPGRSWKGDRGRIIQGRGTLLEEKREERVFSGVRFTRDIRVQRNYVRMYTGVSATRGTLSVPHPPPPFHRSRSSSRRWRRKTKSRRGRRHKSLNPVQRIPPTEEVLFSFLSTGFSFFEIALSSFPRGSSRSRRRMSMLEKKFSRYWTTDRVRNATILVFYRPAGNFSRGLSVFLSKKKGTPFRSVRSNDSVQNFSNFVNVTVSFWQFVFSVWVCCLFHCSRWRVSRGGLIYSDI